MYVSMDGSLRLTDKQMEFVWHMAELDEETNARLTHWVTIPEISDSNRAAVKRGGWMPCRDWAASGVESCLNRLVKRGIVEKRSTGERGQWRPRNEYRLTSLGLDAWWAKLDQECREEETV